MLPQLIKYIRDHAKSWPIKLKADDLLMPLFRFNKEANGIVQSEQIGTIVFWFTEEKRNPCLVSKIFDNSLSVEYIKTHVKRQQEINKKIGRAVFLNIYDVAEICNHPVIFQEAINMPTYEMELQKAIYGPSGNLSLLKQVIERHFKEISFLFKHFKKFNASKQILQWGDWSYSVGEDFRNNYGLKLGFLSDNCLDRMKEEINSMSLQRNYVLVDHHCANYFAGQRIVDQIDRSLSKRMSNEPGIIDVFRFIIAYFRASPLNAVYKDWLGAMACSIMDKDGLIITGSPVRRLLHDLGLNTDEPRKNWALVMISFFLRAIDELTFHQQNIFIISRLRTEFEQLTKRLIEIQDQIENDKGCDFLFVLRSQENFVPASKCMPSDNIGQLPCLIEEGYKGFNIVLFKGKYLGVSQDLGFIDFTKIDESLIEEYKKQSRWVIANSLPEAKCLVVEVLSTDLQKEGGEARREIETLSKDVSDREERIKRLITDVEERDRNVDLMRRALEERDKRLEVLEKEGKESKESYRRLTEDLENREKTIGGLIKDVSERDENIRRLMADLEGRVRDLNSVHRELEERGKKIEALNEKMVEQDKRIEGLEKELAEQGKSIDLLLKEVSNREERINVLRGVSASFSPVPLLLDSYEGYNLEQFKDRIYGISKALGPLNLNEEENLSRYEKEGKCAIGDSVSEVKHLIGRILCRDLGKGVFERDMRIEVLEKEVTDRNLGIDGLQKEVLQEESNIAKLNIEIKKCNKKIENLEVNILQKNRNIEILKKDISNRDENIIKLSNDIKEHNNKISTLQEHLLEKDKHIEALKKDISKWNEEIGKLNNESIVMGSYIKELQEEIVNIKSKWWFKFFNRKG